MSTTSRADGGAGSDPPGPCRREPVRSLALGLFLASLGVSVGACGGPPHAARSGPAVTDGATASDSRTTDHGVLLDVTTRPGSAQSALILAWPVAVSERPATRGGLERRAEALRPLLVPFGADVTAETLSGAPALVVRGPDARLAALLPALAVGLHAPLPPSDAAVDPLLPGDTLDSLFPRSRPAPVTPGRAAVLLVHGSAPLAPPALAAVVDAWAVTTKTPASVPAPASAAPVAILRRGAGPARVALSYPITGPLTGPATGSPTTAGGAADSAEGGVPAGTAELLSAALAGGAESRIARALAPAGLEDAQVSAELRRGVLGERLVISLQVQPDEVDLAWQLVVRVMDELAVSPITSAELARARAWLADRLAFERSTAPDLARRRAARLLRADAPLPPEADFDRDVDALSPAGVHRLAVALAHAEPVGLVATPAADAEVDDALWAESLAETSRRGRMPGASAPERRPGVFAVTDALQLVAHVRRADTLVAFELRIAGGALAEPPELPGVGALAAGVLARPLENTPFPVQGRLTRDQLVLSVRAPAERWTEALDLLSRRLARWPQRPEVLEEARVRALQLRAARQTDAARLARALVEQGTGDPVLTRDLLGTSDGLAERTGVEVRNFIEARVAGQPMTLVAVGPIEAGRLIPAARAALGPLARPGTAAPAPPPVRPLRLERRVDGESACAAVGYPLPALRDREFAGAEVLAALVAPAWITRRGTDLSLLVERCGPDARAALVEIVTAVERVALTGSVPGELDQVRARLLGQMARTAEAPDAMAAWLADAEVLHSPFTGADAADHWRDAVLAVDTPLLRKLANALPALDAAVVALAGPSTANPHPEPTENKEISPGGPP